MGGVLVTRVRAPIALVAAFSRANAVLSAAVIGLGVLSGTLLPLFMLASGALVGDLGADRSALFPTVVVIAVFAAERVMDPLREELGRSLWRQVDQSLTQRLMVAMSAPAGLAHVEDPGVRDRVVQAQGGLTDMTPGQAAYYLAQVIAMWVQGLGSLVIVAHFRWWLAPILMVGYAVLFAVSRQHWHEVTVVLYGRTEALRRSYYLRTVALAAAPAKETRVFGLGGWLVDRYRQGWLAVMADVWRARREGWWTAVWASLALGGAELFALWTVVHAGLAGALSLGAATAAGQAVLGGAVLSQYQDSHWLLSECGRALGRIDEVERATTEPAPATEPARVPGAGPGAGWRPVIGGTESAAGLPREAIRFEQVRFAYPGHPAPVFDRFDLEIPAARSPSSVPTGRARRPS